MGSFSLFHHHYHFFGVHGQEEVSEIDEDGELLGSRSQRADRVACLIPNFKLFGSKARTIFKRNGEVGRAKFWVDLLSSSKADNFFLGLFSQIFDFSTSGRSKNYAE